MANKEDDEDWGYCGCLVGFVMFCAMCYGIYCWLKPTDYVKEIEEALVEKDFQQANQLLREMKGNPVYQKDESIFNNKTDYPVYVECVNKVIQAEISFLINEGDQQSSDRLVALINEYPIESNPAIGTTHNSDIIEGNDKYNAEVGKFNDYCNQILSRAISSGNQYLAEAIVLCFKPTLSREKVDTHFWGNDEYDYQFNETEKDKAKKTLKEAIKEKKFEKDY